MTPSSPQLDRLEVIGFRECGRWRLDGSRIRIDLHAHQGDVNVLYSFVSEGVPLYVGKTIQSLKARMSGYANPGPTQSTNIKANANIRGLLSEGKEVLVYALPDNGLLRYGGFHVNLAAGLEDSIVKDIGPNWNRTGKA